MKIDKTPSSIDYGADPDECLESALITFYGMGESDNCTEEVSNPNYGEVYLNEIAEEEREGICFGNGRGGGAGNGFHPIDPNDPFRDDEDAEQERFNLGDVDAIYLDRRDGSCILIGTGDGWGNERGGGITRNEWATL